VRPFSSQSSVGILGQQLSKPTPTFAERSPGLLVPPAVEQIAQKLLARDASERFQTAPELSRAIDVLLAPIPGHGVYRYTLADGSRPSLSDREPSQPRLERPEWPDDAAPDPLAGGAPLFATPTPVGATGLKTIFIRFVRDFERSRRRWPASVRDALRPVPTPALLSLGALVGVLLLVIVIALGAKAVRALSGPAQPAASALASGSAAPQSATPAAADTASEVALQDAQKAGPAALEVLAGKYPHDARVALELARAALAAKDYVKAVGGVGRTLNLDPELSDNKQIASILFQTAQVKAASDASFALLFGPMDKHGPDIAYDLAATEVVKPWVRVRADQGLRSADFTRLATPALSVAVALRYATSCPQRYALLPRARELGDERALGYLNMYRSTTGCGRRQNDDCYACLRGDSRLTDAIDAIKQRAHH